MTEMFLTSDLTDNSLPILKTVFVIPNNIQTGKLGMKISYSKGNKLSLFKEPPMKVHPRLLLNICSSSSNCLNLYDLTPLSTS